MSESKLSQNKYYYSLVRVRYDVFVLPCIRSLREWYFDSGEDIPTEDGRLVEAAPPAEVDTVNSDYPRTKVETFCMLTKFILPLVVTLMVPDMAEQVRFDTIDCHRQTASFTNVVRSRVSL